MAGRSLHWPTKIDEAIVRVRGACGAYLAQLPAWRR
jgi:hypothetical protein